MNRISKKADILRGRTEKRSCSIRGMDQTWHQGRPLIVIMEETLISELSQWPKVELHVHLEGTLEADLFWKLFSKNAAAKGLSCPFSSAQDVSAAYATLTDLSMFLKLYYQNMQVLIDEDDFYELTWAYLTKARSMGIVHVEPFFDPSAHMDRGTA